MRLSFVLASSFLIALAAPNFRSEPAAAQEAASAAPLRLEALDAAFADLVETGVIPGAVLLVAGREGPVHVRAFGLVDPARGTPMREDSLFRLASMTKPILSVAAMILVERGEIALSDPAAKHLPELADLKVLGAGGALAAPARPITVEDLLRHSSGFTYSFAGAADADLRKSYAALDLEQQKADISAEEMLRRLASLPLAFEPGSRFEYGVSTDVLGFLLERVSGRPLDALLNDLVLKPLKMEETGFRVSEADLPRLAQPLASDPLAPWMNRWMRVSAARGEGYLSGGGGLVSTAGDYLRFARMILNRGELEGVRLLAPETVDLMLSDRIAGLAGGPEALTGPGYGFGYGFGVRLADEGGAAPGSRGDANWSGLSGTTFTIDPREGIVGLLMAAAPSPRNETRLLFKRKLHEALQGGR